uniref:F-box-like family protein n=1 Tax=Pithovirus LCPAC401 TaxID=2506595 RepID=A0A481ZCI2_9VIRU|nr:MAG: F-box-like family protein [Pithovirus LCPAC401]
MTSVTDILEQLELKAQDLNYLTPALIQKIFSVLTVKEISLICNINRKFNTICKRESLWKDKVLSDYGIEKKYGEKRLKECLKLT